MGNQQQQENNFKYQNYTRPNLNKDEVIMIKNVFDSLDPETGMIKVSNLRQRYQDSYDKNKYDQIIGMKQVLNFDEFYDIMANDIIDKKLKYGNIQFDSQGLDTDCLFCPTTNNQKIN
ncbi:hypothetical protein IMG5_007960 [Ichthyophthirius multifiliis]|uniref:Uncharacterized protein n=1 Tax=Ichthyophthirius multifiliis TaxID=5932 RepID=G0QJR8_ICHMU|nr:hypothetical protein IMG5_007960 [Ichthyophthirius multifiliis]EGR34537.1 hypothetical protein IMG5_007960 [Ichthyophthirius multifiliis]|eukprot:XP_004039841.1 hypothetical protein IMG5_007960 [Ichthyophthirius multifiliis]